MLLGKAEAQALSLQQQYAVYRAAGAEVEDEWPSLVLAQERLDEALDAEPDLTVLADPRDRELLQLMGVGR